MTTAAQSREGLPAVAARSVSKTFRIPEEQAHTLKQRVLHPRQYGAHHTYRALNDVSFAVQEGEFFGIAGRNGSGKSTLLKCIAGIYRPEGDIWARGRISTLIELGVGFNMELPARENVLMNGIMLGLSPREARRRYESVIEFAELSGFQDLKLKNYSSGMQVRLAFSVAIQVDADILLIDEVLAVGDASFQQKCFDVFNEMRDAGKTIIFVTHDMTAMKRFCQRALLLEHGDPVMIGAPEDVADRYLELNFGRDAEPKDLPGEREGDGDARVVEVWVENEDGERVTAIRQGRRLWLHARVVFAVPVEDPAAALYVLNDEHRAVIVTNTDGLGERTGNFDAGAEVVFSFAFDNILGPGRYSPLITLAHRGFGLNVIDRFNGEFSFVVTSPDSLGGLVDVPIEVGMRRVTPAPAQETSA